MRVIVLDFSSGTLGAGELGWLSEQLAQASSVHVPAIVMGNATDALKLRGYSVIEAAGGEEALEIVQNAKAPIHLLITDVVMPNMDGPTLVRAVKRIRPEMAVIFMSGYAEEAFRRNDEKAEDLHFLPKPFGLKQLAAKVKEVLAGAPAPKRVG